MTKPFTPDVFFRAWEAHGPQKQIPDLVAFRATRSGICA